MNTSSYEEIISLIPQRPPFLFAQEIIDFTKDSIVVRTHLTGKEDFFKGHFPEVPVMPGVLMLEAMFQTGGVLIGKRGGETSASADEKIGVVSKVDKTKFKRVVRPGDTLEIKVEVSNEFGPAVFFKGKVFVGEELAVTAEFACTLVDKGHLLPSSESAS